MNASAFSDGIFKNNAIFKQMLGLCPTLAVTTSAVNGFAMGIATAAVLVCSNAAVSSLSRFIPKNVRIPVYIVIIACFVTVVDLYMKAYFFELHKVLGLFIPLIVVNCIVLGRAEAYASGNSVINSLLDGLGTGLGFTLSLTILGVCREFLGAGSVFGFKTLPEDFPKTILAVLPPGAFIVLGFLTAGSRLLSRRAKIIKEGRRG